MLTLQTLRRGLPAARILALSVVATGALLGAQSLHGAHANTPVYPEYAVSGPAAAIAGQTVTYTLNVRNTNAQDATNISLSLLGQDTATLEGFTAGNGILCNEVAVNQRVGISCSLDTLAAGASTTMTIRVTLSNASAPTYNVRGYAGPQLCVCIIPTFQTTVTPAATDPTTTTTSPSQPYVPAPNYNGENFDPTAGPNGPA